MRRMRWLMVALMMLLAVQPAAARELPVAKLIAVYFSADWCPNCKVLGPMLDEARSKGALDAKPILFVKLDLTSSSSIHQAMLMARALGIGAYVQQQGSATGYVALLAADNHAELARFDRTTSATEMLAVIEKNLALTEKK